jgi:REP element-mobilizing transposase RayT
LQLLSAAGLARDDAAPRSFPRLLEETRQKYRFAVLGYVIMPEHVHLLMFGGDA